MRIKINRGKQKKLTKDILRKATLRAGKRTAVTGRKLAAPEVVKKSGLASKRVRSNLKAKGPTLRATGGPRNLIDYRARQQRRGVRARPYGRSQLFRGAFIALGKVFTRESDRQNPNRPGNLTRHSEGLKGLTGPGVAGTTKRVVDRREWREAVRKRFKQVMQQELRFRLGLGRRKK